MIPIHNHQPHNTPLQTNVPFTSHTLPQAINPHNLYQDLILSSAVIQATFKIKPNTFDGEGSFNQFVIQFELAANFINGLKKGELRF